MKIYKKQLEQHYKDACLQLSTQNTINDVLNIKAEYLGKKGIFTQELKKLTQLNVHERPVFGQIINQFKKKLELDIKKNLQQIKQQKNAKQQIDISLSGRELYKLGTLHPISLISQKIIKIFEKLSFKLTIGPEIEDIYYNFNALNIPEHHPAREMQDTFYFDQQKVLRTHTSPVQIRTLENHKPPLYIISYGKVYRCDFDATHTPMFHQLEGLAIDKSLSFANLKWLLHYFINEFFNTNLDIRFRASYFPFTEPSAEMDIQCVICKSKNSDCRICKGSGWLEILGCGMVHPQVLLNSKIDNHKYRGFAFGIGVDRLAMLYYGINDLRLLFENDERFLQQF